MPTPSNRWEVYTDPTSGRKYDPFRLLTSLQFYAGGAGRLNELVKTQSEPESILRLAAIGRKAFGFPPVNPDTGEGVPDPVALQAVEDFSKYVRGKGEGAGNWRSWLRSSASPPLSTPKNCSDCG